MAEKQLSKEQTEQLEEKIKELVADGWSKHQAAQAAPIMLGLSDGDVVEIED